MKATKNLQSLIFFQIPGSALPNFAKGTMYTTAAGDGRTGVKVK